MILASPTWLKVGISLVFWMNSLIILDASSSRTLKKIEVLSVENTEQVHMEFDREFLDEPVFFFKAGSLSLLLDSVQKDQKLLFQLNQSLMKQLDACKAF